MRKILILVEGATEETFVSGTLAKYLAQYNVYPAAKIIMTKKVKKGANFKGGITSYELVKNDVMKLLKDPSAALVTTFIDFYHLPTEFPGKRDKAYEKISLYTERVKYLESKFKEAIAHPHFLPYLALHEFEAMLFTDTEIIANAFPGKSKKASLDAIKKQFNFPEKINDQNPPSKRLMEVYPDYKKTFHGSLVVDQIGLPRIRQECPHFNEWLLQLEKVH